MSAFKWLKPSNTYLFGSFVRWCSTQYLLIGALNSQNFDGQKITLRIHECVAFAAPRFSHIIALFGATHDAGFDRLTVNDRCTWLFLSALSLAHSHVQDLQNTIPNAFPLPPAKIVIDGLPLGNSWGSIRQEHPLRKTYKIALTTSRRETNGPRPCRTIGSHASMEKEFDDLW